ncbi:MAG: CxxC-x17-CxxC domain-containing protein [Nanoarchaeota archaeon]
MGEYHKKDRAFGKFARAPAADERRPRYEAHRPSAPDTGFRSRRPEYGGPRDRFDRSPSRDSPLQLFSAVCAKCGNDCEVPFKPRLGKAVLCRECFTRKEEPHERRGPTGPRPDTELLQDINFKLDKIMRALKVR